MQSDPSEFNKLIVLGARRFQQAIDPFIRKVEAFARRVDAEVRAVRKDARRRDHDAGPPNRGMVWVSNYTLSTSLHLDGLPFYAPVTRPDAWVAGWMRGDLWANDPMGELRAMIDGQGEGGRFLDVRTFQYLLVAVDHDAPRLGEPANRLYFQDDMGLAARVCRAIAQRMKDRVERFDDDPAAVDRLLADARATVSRELEPLRRCAEQGVDDLEAVASLPDGQRDAYLADRLAREQGGCRTYAAVCKWL